MLSMIESALWACLFSSGVTSLERATARLRLAHSLMFSGSFIPAQLRKSEILVILVSFILSPDSSRSSSVFSATILLSSSLSIIY